MFGFGKTSAAAKDREAALERSKQTVRDFVQKIASATPEDAERMGQQLRDWCGKDREVPFEFKRKAMLRAKILECSTNMRVCDAHLHEAADEAGVGRLNERDAKLAEARRYYGRACKLGAEEEWRKAYQRAEETLRLTGIDRDTPSRAKV
jgi:hypothetical protein